MKDRSLIFLFFITLLGFILRFTLLTEYPPSLNWDEVSHGYNAYSILRTGRDEWGKLLPVTNFRAYGDYPLPLNLYLTIPSIFIFGLNEFATRLPHALLGTVGIFATFFLVYGITKNKKLSLLSAFLIAIEPWTLFTSRFVLQSNISTYLLIISMALFFNRRKNKLLLPIAFLFLGLTLYAYHTTRIFAPILLIVLGVVYRDELRLAIKRRTRTFFLSLAIILLFFLPIPFILLNPEARARSNVVFLLNEGSVNEIISARASSNLPETLKRLVFNRPIYFTTHFIQNYLEYFSPKYLFFEGGTQFQFSIPQHGVLYLVNLPFFYVGLLVLFKRSVKDRDYRFILLWLLLAPIPASITNEKYAVLRSTTMLPIPAFLTSMGLYYFLDLIQKKFSNSKFVLPELLFISYIVLLLISTESYLNIYFDSYRRNYSWSWQYGYKEAVNYVNKNYGKYTNIIVTKKYGEPHEFFLFFGKDASAPWNWQPEKFRTDPNLIRYYQSNWYWVDAFDKFYFVNDWEIPKKDSIFVLESRKKEVNCEANNNKCLLVTSPGNAPHGWNKIKTINFLDDKPTFEIYEN